jgi:hypothetical protein
MFSKDRREIEPGICDARRELAARFVRGPVVVEWETFLDFMVAIGEAVRGLLVRVAVGIRGLDGLESTFGAMFGAL